MSWYAIDETSIEKTSWKSVPVKPRKCEVDDIGQEQFDTGNLFICPPLQSLLKMKGYYFSEGTKHIEFNVKDSNNPDPKFLPTWYNIVRYDNEQLFDVKNHKTLPIKQISNVVS